MIRHRYFVLLGLVLTSCGLSDSRYRDTSALEKPPTVVVDKSDLPPEALVDENKGDEAEAAAPEQAAEDGAETSDDERETKAKKGLGDQFVSLTDSPKMTLTIKKRFDETWTLMKKAFVQSGIKVTDLEHDKGKFYVMYDADAFVSAHGSLLDKSLGLFSDDYAEQGYLLMLADVGEATRVTAEPSKEAELRKRSDHDDEAESDADTDTKPLADGAEKLLRSLYLTLRDELVESH